MNVRHTSPAPRHIYCLLSSWSRHRESLFGTATHQCACFSTQTSSSKSTKRKRNVSATDVKDSLEAAQNGGTDNSSQSFDDLKAKLKEAVQNGGTNNSSQSFDDLKAKLKEAVQNGGTDNSSQSFDDLKAKLKTTRNRYSYVFDPGVAEKIASAITRRRTNPTAPVLDVRAGPGVVGREFLKHGAAQVVLLEINRDFSSLLTNLEKSIGSDRLRYFGWHMLNLYHKLHGSSQDKAVQTYQRMERKVAGCLMSTSLPHTDVPYSLISTGGKQDSDHFLYHILRNLPHDDPILSRGRVEFFFLVQAKFLSKMMHISNMKMLEPGQPNLFRDRAEDTHFTYIHLMVHLFYNTEILDELDATDLYPPLKPVKSSLTLLSGGMDASKRYLMRMQVKEDIDELLPLHQHTMFMNFLFQVYKRKASRVVPTMEMLIPGCGLRMLGLGFTMMDTVVMCSPEELLSLYKAMLDWPEYTSSPLHSYLMMKTTGSAESDSKQESGIH